MASKPPSPVRVGLPADELLKLRGRSRADMTTHPGRVMGYDEEGQVVAWDYADCVVILAHRQGRYRVVEVQVTGAEEEGNDGDAR